MGLQERVEEWADKRERVEWGDKREEEECDYKREGRKGLKIESGGMA
jgi:hypothetical protein